MPLWDYQCNKCSVVVEEIRSQDARDDIRKCVNKECDGLLHRMLCAPPFKLEGVSGHFPTAADRWADQHTKAAKKGLIYED